MRKLKAIWHLLTRHQYCNITIDVNAHEGGSCVSLVTNLPMDRLKDLLLIAGNAIKIAEEQEDLLNQAKDLLK